MKSLKDVKVQLNNSRFMAKVTSQVASAHLDPDFLKSICDRVALLQSGHLSQHDH